MPNEEPRWKVNQRKRSVEYQKANYKRIPLSVQKEWYETVLKPASVAVGEPVNTFIQKSISERIVREGLYPEGYNSLTPELQKIADEASAFLSATISSYAAIGRRDRVNLWESKLDSYARNYIRASHKLSKHDMDITVKEVVRLYNASKE